MIKDFNQFINESITIRSSNISHITEYLYDNNHRDIEFNLFYYENNEFGKNILTSGKLKLQISQYVDLTDDPDTEFIGLLFFFDKK